MALRNSGASCSGERKRKAAREAVKNLAPEHREAIEATGYGPGDAYIGALGSDRGHEEGSVLCPENLHRPLG
jgi:hypothetical protein